MFRISIFGFRILNIAVYNKPMSDKTKFIVLALALLIIAAPLAVWAASPSLVPCGRSSDSNPDDKIDETAPCSLCHLYVLVQNVLDFMMWTIAPIVAVLAVGWAGFNIMISGEQPGLRAKGFGIIKTTVIGLAIMFAGWVLINEALLFFTGKDNTGTANKTSFIQSPWNQVTCIPPTYIKAD